MDTSWDDALRDLMSALRTDPELPRVVGRSPRLRNATAAGWPGLRVDDLSALCRVLPCDTAAHVELTDTGGLGDRVRAARPPGAGVDPADADMARQVLACPLCREPAAFVDVLGVASTADCPAAGRVGRSAAPAGEVFPADTHGVADGEALVVELPGGTPCGARLLTVREHGGFTAAERLRLGLVRPHLAAACQRRAGLLRRGMITQRQRQVLELVEEGCTNSEIGARLRLSPGTVRKHLDNIFAELRVSSRAAAAASVRVPAR